MAINITNILNAITAKNNNADSTYSNFELSQINRAVNTLNETNGVITYNSASELPSGDSAIMGQIAFVSGVFVVDSTSHIGSFYYYNGDSWGIATLTADSDYLNSAEAAAAAGPHYQGSVSGYVSGGGNPAGNIIEKYSFTSDGNGTDVGDLTVARNNVTGQSSSTNGYASGGSPGAAASLTIDKFPFAVDANATDVGDLGDGRLGMAGTSSTTHGYATAGSRVTPPAASGLIERFPFASDANSTSVGTITQNIRNVVGTTSTEYGYTSGGTASPIAVGNFIDKFPFATALANGADVGDLVNAGDNARPQSSSSDTHGYFMGSLGPGSVLRDTIQKFSFSTDGNATDVANLTSGRYTGSGTSSTDNGYVAGGATVPVRTPTNIIEKFPFAVDANATDVGDLTSVRDFNSGQQV